MKTFDQLRSELILGESKSDDFEPHMMYDPKTGESEMAKVPADHIRMKKMGWTHDKPKDLEEAVAKIACLKCDEVSTAAAWKKKGGYCPKCKVSNQGVAE